MWSNTPPNIIPLPCSKIPTPPPPPSLPVHPQPVPKPFQPLTLKSVPQRSNFNRILIRTAIGGRNAWDFGTANPIDDDDGASSASKKVNDDDGASSASKKVNDVVLADKGDSGNVVFAEKGDSEYDAVFAENVNPEYDVVFAGKVESGNAVVEKGKSGQNAVFAEKDESGNAAVVIGKGDSGNDAKVPKPFQPLTLKSVLPRSKKNRRLIRNVTGGRNAWDFGTANPIEDGDGASSASKKVNDVVLADKGDSGNDVVFADSENDAVFAGKGDSKNDVVGKGKSGQNAAVVIGKGDSGNDDVIAEKVEVGKGELGNDAVSAEKGESDVVEKRASSDKLDAVVVNKKAKEFDFNHVNVFDFDYHCDVSVPGIIRAKGRGDTSLVVAPVIYLVFGWIAFTSIAMLQKRFVKALLKRINQKAKSKTKPNNEG